MYLNDMYVNSSGQPDESNVSNKKAKAVVGTPLGCKLSKGSGHFLFCLSNLDKLQTYVESAKIFPKMRNAWAKGCSIFPFSRP